MEIFSLGNLTLLLINFICLIKLKLKFNRNKNCANNSSNDFKFSSFSLKVKMKLKNQFQENEVQVIWKYLNLTNVVMLFYTKSKQKNLFSYALYFFATSKRFNKIKKLENKKRFEKISIVKTIKLSFFKISFIKSFFHDF